ncbi:hypothetical protein FCV25MIE_15467 [Fagus crenata]
MGFSFAQRETTSEDCLLSLFWRFLSKKSRNRRAIHEVLRRAWRMGPDLRIIDVGIDIFQFKFPTEAQRDWVYDNGSWTFENDILLLHQWKEGLNVANIRFTHSQMWVQLWGIPFDLMSKAVGMEIGNNMGTCIRVDDRLWSTDQARFMHIRVALMVEVPLRRGGMIVSLEGERTWVHYWYERLPMFCFRCGVLGHDVQVCHQTTLVEERDLQYGVWLRGNGGMKEIGTPGFPFRFSARPEAPVATTSQPVSGEGESQGHHDVVINASVIRGNNGSNGGDESNGKGEFSNLNSHGLNMEVEVRGKEMLHENGCLTDTKRLASVIRGDDSIEIISESPCKNLNSDIRTDLEIGGGPSIPSQKPKKPATWKRIHVDHMPYVTYTLGNGKIGSKRSFGLNDVVQPVNGSKRTKSDVEEHHIVDSDCLAAADAQPCHLQ